MRPSLIIPRIREECPIFGGRVAGAITVERAMEQTNLAPPSCFVVPLGDAAEGETKISDLAQELALVFGLAVCLSNPEETGQVAVEAAHDVLDQLLPALVGFQPNEHYGPILYRGWEFNADNRARAWVSFAFESSRYTDAG